MWVFALYFSFLIIGFLLGSKTVPKGKEIKHTNMIFMVLVFLIIFLMGMVIGSDEKVISSLGSIGITSFVLAVSALTGSVLSVTALRKLMKIDRKGIRHYE